MTRESEVEVPRVVVVIWVVPQSVTEGIGVHGIVIDASRAMQHRPRRNSSSLKMRRA